MSPDPTDTGFLDVALSPRAYGALAYQIAGLPLAIAAFTWVVVGIPLSVGLSFIGIGLLLGLAYLLGSRAMAVAQGTLAAYLTGEPAPTALAMPEAQGFWARLGALLKDPASWGAQAYLFLRMPLGVVGFALSVTFLSLSLSALYLGLFPWYHLESMGDGLVQFQSRYGSGTCDLGSVPLAQAFLHHPGPARITAAALGFVGLLFTLHAAVVLTRAEARAAFKLLRRRGA